MQMTGGKLALQPETDVGSELPLTSFPVTHTGLTAGHSELPLTSFPVTHTGLTAGHS